MRPWFRAWSGWVALLVLVAASLCVPGQVRAQRPASEADVEAAYLINFLRYTQWPQRSFESPDSPLVLTVVGPASVAARVQAVAAAAGKVGGRRVEVRSLPYSRGSLAAPLQSERDREMLLQMRASHLVYFHSSSAALHPKALADLWGQPVLTVSNAPGFASEGGMIGLFRSSGHVVFDANPVAIRNSGLLVSAKVLKLARTTARMPR
jgi:hypothetical protein